MEKDEINGVVEHQQGDTSKKAMIEEDAKVDGMEVETTTTSSNEDGVLTVNSYSRSFPIKLGKDLQEAWPEVNSVLEKYGISCTINLGEVAGSMTISTTRKTANLEHFLRARGLVILLCENCPARAALSVIWKKTDIISIGLRREGLCSKFGITKEQYLERRKLLRPALKELGQLTGCSLLFLHGDHIVATGSVEGLKLARKIVEDCIVHKVRPLSQIRRIKKMNGVIDDLGSFHF